MAGLAAVALLTTCGYWRTAGGRWLVALWLLPPLAVVPAIVSFEFTKFRVLRTAPQLRQDLGRHFVVGYSSFDEVAQLAAKGLIGGVYVTGSNVAGKDPLQIRAEIAVLQERRRDAGWPPLIVATDQEGGAVSHLSPPLMRLPPLSALAELPPDIRAKLAEELGRAQGRELASIGVTVNFAPVLDLKPPVRRTRLDLNTRIGDRAISGDPAVVSDVALGFVRGLEAAGVDATIKHFPGLGRVASDTHIVSAALDTPLDELEASDWRPFRDVLAGTKAQLMVGHVNLTAVDPDRPASHSKAVIDGIIRKRWNYDGVIITDDLDMGAVFTHVCTAVVEALNAGADLLLVAYDGAQFYRMFACASAARNKLDPEMLAKSAARLDRLLPKAPPATSERAGAQPAGG
jgi:beta-N-acetylhexosaminidase